MLPMKELNDFTGRVVAPTLVLGFGKREEKVRRAHEGDGAERQILKRRHDGPSGVI
jgi:hypothetical protein